MRLYFHGNHLKPWLNFRLWLKITALSFSFSVNNLQISVWLSTDAAGIFVNPWRAWSQLMSKRSTDVISVKEKISHLWHLNQLNQHRSRKCHKHFELHLWMLICFSVLFRLRIINTAMRGTVRTSSLAAAQRCRMSSGTNVQFVTNFGPMTHMYLPEHWHANWIRHDFWHYINQSMKIGLFRSKC